MKVLFINNYLHEDYAGGAEQSSRILINKLSESNQMYTLSFWNENTVKKRGRVINIYLKESKVLQTKYLQHFARQLNITLLLKMVSIVKRINPDIIHFNNIQGFPALLIKLLGNYKIVHTLRDYNTLCFRNSLFKKGNICKHCTLCKFQAVFKKWGYQGIDALVSNSQLTLDIHNKYGYKKEQQSVIYAGYEESKSELDLLESSDSLNVGYIGKINQAKGCHILNYIAKKLYKKNNNKLLVAGTGDSEIISSFNPEFIEYLGFCEADSFYKKVDAIVVPSIWYDPLPRVIYEAMSHDVVPFVSIITGGEKIIKDIDKRLLFNPRSKKSLDNLVKKIGHISLFNEAKKRIRRMIQKEKYSLVLAGEQYNEVYYMLDD